MNIEIIGYIAAIFMGVSLGLVGGGGSILTVPILVYLFSVDPLIATSASLFIVGAAALLGGALSFRRGEVHLNTAIQFAVPSFAGVFLTKNILVPKIPNQILSIQNFNVTKPLLIMGIFAVLMLLASFAMIKGKKPIEKNPSEKKWTSIAGQGFLVGGVTGLVGAGGGFLIVPALVNLVGLNMRSAIGTSLMIIAANSLFGFGLALHGGLNVDWKILGSILGVALVGLLVGSYYSKRVSEKKLKSGFGYFVLIMGGLILFDQIRRL